MPPTSILRRGPIGFQRNSRLPYEHEIHFDGLEKSIDEELQADQLKLIRRSFYKINKDEATPVWTPVLEAVLLQSLCNYTLNMNHRKEDQSRNEGLPPQRKRHSDRNVYISKCILEKTKYYRTPTQVASRLQQLQHTGDALVIKMISGHSIPDTDILTTSMAVSPLVPISIDGSNTNTLLVPVVIQMESTSHCPTVPPEITLFSSFQKIRLQTVKAQPYSKITGSMDPNIILLSPVPLDLQSNLDVIKNDKQYGTSTTTLVPCGRKGKNWCYATSVAGEFWDIIADKDKLRERRSWTIVQAVAPADDKEDLFARIVYQFEGDRRIKLTAEFGEASHQCRELPLMTNNYSQGTTTTESLLQTTELDTHQRADEGNANYETVALLGDMPPQSTQSHWTTNESSVVLNPGYTSHNSHHQPGTGASPITWTGAYSITNEFMGYYPKHDY